MKVITFGEVLLRLSAPGYARLFQENSFCSSFCGGEVNVAVSAANYGMESCFVTTLPEGAVGDAVVHEIRAFGVDMSKCLREDGRLGLYYFEKGASQRPSKIIYDRKGSTFSKIKTGQIKWKELIEDGDWLHFTGINPALGSNVAEVCIEACRAAKQAGAVISCDLNYRAKLWSEDHARAVMKDIMPFVDVCIANEEDIEKILGLKIENTDVQKGELDVDAYSKVASEIADLFGCRYVAVSLRESLSADVNNWSGLLYSAGEKKSYLSEKYTINLVDRVGGGDSFSGGLIYALANHYDTQKAISFAAAASCLKQTMNGDFNRATKEEVWNLMAGNASGRVQR